VALTGVPLIVLACLVAAAAVAATALVWSRFGRWRLLTRTVGLLLSEVLLVAAVGLVVNRVDQFYPSWQALRGDTGTVTVTPTRAAGRLDRTLAGQRAGVPWRPPDLGRWRLAAVPDVVVPNGYRQRPADAFPVLLALTATGDAAKAARAAAGTPDVVTVVLAPSPRTTAAALATLEAQLARDLRVTGRGWALLTDAAHAVLAGALLRAAPTRYAALVVTANSASGGLPGAVRPGPGVAVAVVRPAPAAGAHPRALTAGTTTLPASAASAASAATPWSVAAGWAATQLSPPLAAPVLLPAAADTQKLARRR
jgi:hypothetical protein